jgi:hypothetical protein
VVLEHALHGDKSISIPNIPCGILAKLDTFGHNRRNHFFQKIIVKLREVIIGSWSNFVGHQPQWLTTPHSMGSMRS